MSEHSKDAIAPLPEKLIAQLRTALYAMQTPKEGFCLRCRLDCAGEVIAALANFEAALAVPAEPHREWQPIETAPKDSQPVLVAAPSFDTGEPCVYVAQRNSDFTDWWSYGHMCGGCMNNKATHWMPLPLPPPPSEDQ